MLNVSKKYPIGGGTPDNFFPGEKITRSFIDEGKGSGGALRLDLDCGITLCFYDDASYCCEHRYIETDDEVDSIEGESYRGFELKETTSGEGEWEECLDCAFLEIQTDKDHITIKNYNSHNGYYGGWDLEVSCLGSLTQEQESYCRIKYPFLFE